MKANVFIVLLLLVSSSIVRAQEVVALYPEGTSEDNGLMGKERMYDNDFMLNVSNARMLAFPADAEKANGTAVLICPGGGYVGL